MISSMRFSRGEPPHFVEAELLFCGDDIVITVGGGDRYHTGAVAIAYQYPSIKNPSRMTTTTSIITIPGHKEDEIARSAALILSQKKNRTVTIAVGLHIDHASPKDIDQLVINFNLLIKDILDSI